MEPKECIEAPPGTASAHPSGRDCGELPWTVRQAAIFLGVSPQSVYLWVERRQIYLTSGSWDATFVFSLLTSNSFGPPSGKMLTLTRLCVLDSVTPRHRPCELPSLDPRCPVFLHFLTGESVFRSKANLERRRYRGLADLTYSTSRGSYSPIRISLRSRNGQSQSGALSAHSSWQETSDGPRRLSAGRHT